MADRLRQKLIFAHQEWLGFVQPVGVVVAPSVMVEAQVVPDRNVRGRRQELSELLEDVERATVGPPRAKPPRRLHEVPRLGGQ